MMPQRGCKLLTLRIAGYTIEMAGKTGRLTVGNFGF